jgi:hypothetical protein
VERNYCAGKLIPYHTIIVKEVMLGNAHLKSMCYSVSLLSLEVFHVSLIADTEVCGI